MILCVIGEIGSGKTTVAQMLGRKRFQVIELGDVVRESMRSKGMPIDRKSIRDYALKMRLRYGKDVFAKHTARLIKGKKRNVAIFGVRSDYELKYLKRHLKHLKTVAIFASEKVRFLRIKKRKKHEDPKTIKEFIWLERKEERGYMNSQKERKHGILTVIKNADYVLANTGTLQELERSLDRLILAVG